MIYFLFSAPIIGSVSIYETCTVSIPTITPHSPLTVAPTEDITTPVPTMKTNDYGIYVNIPRPPLPNTTPPLIHQTPPTTFTQLYQIFYSRIIFVTRIFCIYFGYFIKYLIYFQQIYTWSTPCIFMATLFKYKIYLVTLLERY